MLLPLVTLCAHETDVLDKKEPTPVIPRLFTGIICFGIVMNQLEKCGKVIYYTESNRKHLQKHF